MIGTYNNSVGEQTVEIDDYLKTRIDIRRLNV
jgi:hypothetical protein